MFGGIQTVRRRQPSRRRYLGAVNHTYGIDDLTFRYGLEGGTLDFQTSALIDVDAGSPRLPIPLEPTTDTAISI